METHQLQEEALGPIAIDHAWSVEPSPQEASHSRSAGLSTGGADSAEEASLRNSITNLVDRPLHSGEISTTRKRFKQETAGGLSSTELFTERKSYTRDVPVTPSSNEQSSEQMHTVEDAAVLLVCKKQVIVRKSPTKLTNAPMDNFGPSDATRSATNPLINMAGHAGDDPAWVCSSEEYIQRTVSADPSSLSLGSVADNTQRGSSTRGGTIGHSAPKPLTVRTVCVEISGVNTTATNLSTVRIDATEPATFRTDINEASIAPSTPRTNAENPSTVRTDSIGQVTTSNIFTETATPIIRVPELKMRAKEPSSVTTNSTECPRAGMNLMEQLPVRSDSLKTSTGRPCPSIFAEASHLRTLTEFSDPQTPCMRQLCFTPTTPAELGHLNGSGILWSEKHHAMFLEQPSVALHQSEKRDWTVMESVAMACHHEPQTLVPAGAGTEWLTSSRPPITEETTRVSPHPSAAGSSLTASWGTPATEDATFGSPKSAMTEMECPVCLNAYDIYRLPKCLSCHHTFCNVCLKLLQCPEAGAWHIICPLCRMPTIVPGGLIRCLPNQEAVLIQLRSTIGTPKVCAHLPRLQQQAGPSVCRQPDIERHSEGLWAPAQRLGALLAFLVLLLIIVFLFLSSGPVRWSLCGVMGLSLVSSVLLCWKPHLRGCSDSGR